MEDGRRGGSRPLPTRDSGADQEPGKWRDEGRHSEDVQSGRAAGGRHDNDATFIAATFPYIMSFKNRHGNKMGRGKGRLLGVGRSPSTSPVTTMAWVEELAIQEMIESIIQETQMQVSETGGRDDLSSEDWWSLSTSPSPLTL